MKNWGPLLAMAGAVAWGRRAPVLPDPAAALVTIELRDQSGRMLPGLIVGHRWFVVGEESRRYSIVVRNRSDLRLEIVLSVDGLDVIDGRSALFRKRGYILNPHQKLVVEGFRQSTEAVAAFRFGPVRESYAAEKYHNTRNVGVIGIALFNEGLRPGDQRRSAPSFESEPISWTVRHSTLMAWRFRRPRVSFASRAEILHQDLRLPDERARLGAGCAFAHCPRL